MRRRIFLLNVALTAAEVGTLAVLLRVVLTLQVNQPAAGALALAPSLIVLAGSWIFFSRRWTAGLAPSSPPEQAREAVVLLPRRILFPRSFASAGVAVLLAPFLASATNLGAETAADIAGGAVGVAFAFNNLRAMLYRRMLAPRVAELYAADPLLYEAHTLRERMFVAANVLGVAGTVAGGLYSYFVIGASLREFADLASVFPALVLVLCTAFGLDIWRETRPVVAWAAGTQRASAAKAFARATSLPYRLAGSNLITWMIAGATVALRDWQHGALTSEALQVLAGVVAVGFGVVMYQAAWHRRLLAGVRDAAAAAVLAEGSEVPRSRLSIQPKLMIAFSLLLGFGGTFAFTTSYAEHERFLSLAASQRAAEDLDGLLERSSRAALAAPEGLRLRQGSAGTLLVLTGRGLHASRPLPLPPGLDDRMRAVEAGSTPVPALRASIAWRHVPEGPILGVLNPWRQANSGPWGMGPLAFVFASLLLASMGAMLLFSQELASPIRALERHARRLGKGQLDAPIPITEADEVGGLAAALETSRRQLQQTLAEIHELNASLEQRVQIRTAELARALKALAQAQEQVVGSEKLASLGRLAAGIAHEVNNPLNFVKNALPPLRESLGLMERALEGSASGAREALNESRDAVRVMQNGVERMALILRGLLDFARQPTDGPPQRFDLAQVVDSALALMRHDLRDRIDIKVDLGSVSQMTGHPSLLGQALVNLIKNAAEALEGTGEVEVLARHVEGGVELAVRDSGKGMSPEVVRRALEPFFTTKAVGQGTGLGLAMVHGIAQKHGGSVNLTSSPGAGTTVALFLPQHSS